MKSLLARIFAGPRDRDDSDDPRHKKSGDELRRVNRMMADLGPYGLLLPAEAATLLRVSINRLYELLIPKVRIGRRVRYQVKHLQHYLNTNTDDPWRHQ